MIDRIGPDQEATARTLVLRSPAAVLLQPSQWSRRCFRRPPCPPAGRRPRRTHHARWHGRADSCKRGRSWESFAVIAKRGCGEKYGSRVGGSKQCGPSRSRQVMSLVKDHEVEEAARHRLDVRGSRAHSAASQVHVSTWRHAAQSFFVARCSATATLGSALFFARTPAALARAGSRNAASTWLRISLPGTTTSTRSAAKTYGASVATAVFRHLSGAQSELAAWTLSRALPAPSARRPGPP